MLKVKKTTVVTGERNRKEKAGTSNAKVGKRTAKVGARTAKGGSTPAGGKKGKLGPSRKVAKVQATSRAKSGVAVRSLDPIRKCGPNTSVQLLYRVDESVDGRKTAHLVFFDKHGWYCEHGRTCPAVGYARKFKGQIARVS